MIASTLDDRAAFDAGVDHRPQLRADDAAGQRELAACLQRRGFTRSDCLEMVEASLDSRGLFCPDALVITSAGRTCVQRSTPSAAKLAVLQAEADARTAAAARRPVLLALGLGAVAAGAAWWLLR